MHLAQTDLERFLDDLARQARPGDRVPPIRDLVKRFGTSQLLVQRAFADLKARGLIASHVGRGTYFLAGGGQVPDAPPPAVAGAVARRGRVQSVLLLRRSISIARGRVLMEQLQRRFDSEGHRVLEVSYTDPDHARTVLRGLPRFDACVVQSSFKTITIELLAALRDKADVLAVDGAALVGTDVEAVGTEWGEPLAAAVDRLRQRGHRRIAYATTTHPLLATQLGRRRFESLRQAGADAEWPLIELPLLPDQGFEAALADAIRARADAAGRLPFTALVAWGIEDGAAFRALLSAAGFEVPVDLSVVLLGRTDLANEHGNYFETFGCSVADQVEGLYQAVQARWRDPDAPYGVRLMPVTHRAGQSVGNPVAGPPALGKPRQPAHPVGR